MFLCIYASMLRGRTADLLEELAQTRPELQLLGLLTRLTEAPGSFKRHGDRAQAMRRR